MFDIYGYDQDNGELMFIEHSIPAEEYKSFAQELHDDGYDIKVVDQEDGCVVWTFGRFLAPGIKRERQTKQSPLKAGWRSNGNLSR
jgi:hypothetical protein